MPFKESIKAKFATKKGQKKEESKNGSTRPSSLGIVTEEAPSTSRDSSLCEDDFETESEEGFPKHPISSSMSAAGAAGHDVSSQLVDVEEQLVAAMMENEALKKEITQLRDESKVKELEQKLSHQTSKALDLEDQLRDFVRGQIERTPPVRRQTCSTPEIMEHEEYTEAKGGIMQIFWQRLVVLSYEFLDNFTEMEESDEKETEETLTVKKLKTNVIRFKNGIQPFINTVQGLRALFGWKHATSSLLLFLAYMYTAWHQWLGSFLLLLIIFRLTINFLNSKGFHISLNLLWEYEETGESSKNFSTMGMGDKFDVVLQVATKVQNTLGFLADNLEKLWNLFTWQQPEYTAPLFFGLVALFIASCLLQAQTLLTSIALYMGIKMFIIEYLYMKFPRLQCNHDTIYKMWINLKTDEELKVSSTTIKSQDVNRATSGKDNISTSSAEDELSEEIRMFLDLFEFPPSERPLPGWGEGKSCGLIEPESKTIAAAWKAFKYGKMYLTSSYLCYVRNKKNSPKNIAIPLQDIQKFSKVKPYAWLPGSGMSVAVHVKHLEKPYVFGAILSRDETFEAIVNHGVLYNFPWAAVASKKFLGKGKKEGKRKRKTSSKQGSSDEEGGHSESEDCGEMDSTTLLDVVDGKDDVRHRNTTLRMSDLKDDLDESTTGDV